MFNPSRDQVRGFFIDTWRKHTEGTVLVGLEPVAVDVLSLHPEYHALLLLGDAAGTLHREWTPEDGAVNPFLHLSMHLAIEEQLAIDQPRGIVAAFATLMARTRDRHAAVHAALECLGEMLWRSQRDNAPPDGEAYLECVRRSG